jgi:hypothetical protein
MEYKNSKVLVELANQSFISISINKRTGINYIEYNTSKVQIDVGEFYTFLDSSLNDLSTSADYITVNIDKPSNDFTYVSDTIDIQVT